MKISVLYDRLSDYYSELKENERTDNTLKAYRIDLSQFFEWLQKNNKDDNAELSKSDVIEYKDYLRHKNLKPVTVNRKILSINEFLKKAGAEDATGTRIIKLQQKTSLDNVLTVSEYERMLNAALYPGKQATAAGLRPDPQAWAIMQTLAATGIRYGELKFFTVESVRSAPSNSNAITVENKGKLRNIPVSKDLQKLLKEYCKQMNIDKGYIFGTRNGTPIMNEQISRRLKRIAGYARIDKDKIHPHNFRHLFAKSYMEKIGRLDELKDILGHNSIATTSIYTRTTNKEKADNISKLGLISGSRKGKGL